MEHDCASHAVHVVLQSGDLDDSPREPRACRAAALHVREVLPPHPAQK